MKTQTYTVAGTETSTHFVETADDARAFLTWRKSQSGVLALDSETTGLEIFSAGYALRLVQIGDRDTAYVLDAHRFADVIREALSVGYFVAHSFPFDGLVLDRHLGVKLEDLGPRVFDTRIFSHLLDPRAAHEGGLGHHLKGLCEAYVDPTAPDTQKALYEVFRKEYGATKETGWALIDINHPLYWLYAGLDVILARRLFDELVPLIKGAGLADLSTFEHRAMLALATMQRRGVLVDVDYCTQLGDGLAVDAQHFRDVAARYGVENVNSTAQVAAALSAMGETLTEHTPSGAVKVDKGVLLPLADLDLQWHPIEARKANPLADAVLRSKRAEKWRTAYAGAFLNLRDEDNRLHPSIGALQARTARMSISRPPLQQLPSSDWRVRRALIADPGEVIVACDFDQVEMKVLAAMCGDTRLQEAIKSGVDLHDFTAGMIYGPDFTKADRKIAKTVGFAQVYGGGATTIARQAGITPAQAKEAVTAYSRTYPGIKRYGRRLQQRAEFGKREVTTASGRHLPLDRDRLYSATNYVVQSTARDLFVECLLDMFDAGLGDFLRLPVHDEIVASVPAEQADDVAAELGRIMSRDFYGVPITATGEIYGRSWGAGYLITDEDKAAHAATFTH